MFPDSLATGGWFSSHWTVVLVVALLFFAVQVALSLRISRSLRRQERLLGRLCRDLAHGGDGRPAVDALPGARLTGTSGGRGTNGSYSVAEFHFRLN